MTVFLLFALSESCTIGAVVWTSSLPPSSDAMLRDAAGLNGSQTHGTTHSHFGCRRQQSSCCDAKISRSLCLFFNLIGNVLALRDIRCNVLCPRRFCVSDTSSIPSCEHIQNITPPIFKHLFPFERTSGQHSHTWNGCTRPCSARTTFPWCCQAQSCCSRRTSHEPFSVANDQRRPRCCQTAANCSNVCIQAMSIMSRAPSCCDSHSSHLRHTAPTDIAALTETDRQPHTNNMLDETGH